MQFPEVGGLKGHLWQERFHSFVMDEMYLLATVKYVEQNSVKAKLCTRPEQWRWSSATAHLKGCDDQVVKVAPMLDRVSNWKEYLSSENKQEESESIKRYSSSGRPAGSSTFIEVLELLTGRSLQKKKPGPKPGIK